MKPDRIDFVTTPAGVVVTKMHRNREAQVDTPYSTGVKELDLAAALHWCKANGYTVLEWKDPAGRPCARAFLGEPWPIRRNWEIKDLRARLNDLWLREFHAGKWNGQPHPIERLLGMDLAVAG